MNDRPVVFLDTETTSLRHDRRVWEVGLVTRDATGETRGNWFVNLGDLDLGNADPMSLSIGHFHQRHPAYVRDKTQAYDEAFVLGRVEYYTRGALIVGAVPNFDTEVLANRMRAHGICPTWHYHLVDVETLAAGKLGLAPPWDFDAILAKLGLAYDEADRHTALGDARMVQRVYDAVLATPAGATS